MRGRGGLSLRALRFVPILVLAIVAAALPVIPAKEPVPPCPGFTDVPGQGPSCPVEGGWRVMLRDGLSLLTHGPDPAPSVSAAGLSDPATYPAFMPSCVTSTSAYHTRLVYARPSDKADRYDALLAQMRNMVNRTNGHLRLEASYFGTSAAYRFLCDAPDLVHVGRATLPTPSGADSFSSIVSDLRAQGFSGSTTKFLVLYDDGVGGFGGQGNIHHDDRLALNNANNFGDDYGIVYGYFDNWGILTMAHENGHNLGAVQLSAPHSSGGWHCNDGYDTMCYADGGSRSQYSTSACPQVERFDCGNDDYFHPNPSPTSYLGTHWNLASPLNRFFDLGNQAPLMRWIRCEPAVADMQDGTTCSFLADDEGNVSFEVDWGDGTTSRVPPTGTTAPGVAINATHAWPARGAYVITATPTDAASPPRSGHPLAADITVVDCSWVREGALVVGANGVYVAEVTAREERGVPADCAGRPYSLTSSFGSDFNVCWWSDQGYMLRCDSTFPANEEGIIPAGASTARVIYRAGVGGAYVLEAR